MKDDADPENRKNVHDDRPIDGSDKAPDSLGRQDFARRIAQSIFGACTPSGISVSLEGDWGSGKTSLIHLIEREITNANVDTITVKFNPWLVGNADALVSQLMAALRDSIKKKDVSKSLTAVAKAIETYSSVLDVVSLASAISAESILISKGARGLSKLLQGIGEAKKKDIHGTKNALVKELEAHSIRIIIFIDDLDRLPPAEIFEVIRAIKAVIDFPNTSYLVAYDAQYISQSLKSLNIESPERYLEKIFQVRLHVPQLTATDVERLANIELTDLGGGKLTQYFNDDHERLTKMFHTGAKHLIKTPRDLKRMFNGLRFRMAVTNGEVCFADMFGLEMLHVRFPKLYDSIRKHPSLVLPKNEVDYWGLLDEEKEQKDRGERRDTLLVGITKNEKGHLLQILEELFPDIRQSDWEKKTIDAASAKGRVCAYDRLFLAMNSTMPPDEVSIKALTDWATKDERSQSIVASIVERGSSMRFLELANEKASIMKFPNFVRILGDINKLIHSNEAVAKSRDVYSMGGMATDYARWIVSEQIKQMNTEEVRHTLPAVLADIDLAGISSILLRMLCVNQGRYWQQEVINRNLVFPDDEISAWELTFVKNVTKLMQSGDIANLINASSVFYEALRYHRKPIIDILKQRLESDNIDSVLTRIFSGGTDSKGGPYILLREKDFEKGSIYGEELPFTLLEAYVERRSTEEGTLGTEACALFKSIRTQNKCYLRDCQDAEED